MAVAYTGLNGIVKMSFAEYSGMASHDPNTKYIVQNGNVVEEYLGDVRITDESGGSWVTMATFTTYTETQAIIVSAIDARVEALEEWKSETVDPFISTTTSNIAQLNRDIASLINRIAALEAAMNGLKLWKGTQNQYTAIEEKDASTIYFVW